MWKLAPVFLEAAANRNPNSGVGQRQFSNPILYDSRGNPLHFLQIHSNQLTPTGRHSSPLTQCIWTFFWLGVLLCFGYPIGFFTCELYVLLSPFSAIYPKFASVTDFLFKISQFPSLCAKNMIEAKALILM